MRCDALGSTASIAASRRGICRPIILLSRIIINKMTPVYLRTTSIRQESK